LRRDLNGGPSPVGAFSNPVDPLKRGRDVRIVIRDIPNVETVTEWSVHGLREALRNQIRGQFDAPAQLADAILGDDRVQATIGSRISGLFGREVIFEPSRDKAVRGSKAAREALDAWVECWPMLATPAALTEMQAYTILMGFEPAQLLWGTNDDGLDCPTLRPWHPRFTYYHWTERVLYAIGQDGQEPITPGDGKWVLHAPFGEYRGWIRGAIRACAEPWLMRHWAFRDWARYSEKHGIPILKAYSPAASDETQRDAFEQALAQLGSESTILLNRGVDGVNSYDVEFAEPSDDSWQSFPGLIDRCDMSIVLAIMFQNLTTEVKGGSFAATSAHMDVRQGGLEFDNAAWRHTIRTQIARPFAFMNFGDPRLAPWTRYDITPRDELAANADQFSKFGTAVEVLRRGGIEFDDPKALRRFAAKRFGLRQMPTFKIVPPVTSGGGGGKPPGDQDQAAARVMAAYEAWRSGRGRVA
jgi:phage gp29-like protein